MVRGSMSKSPLSHPSDHGVKASSLPREHWLMIPIGTTTWRRFISRASGTVDPRWRWNDPAPRYEHLGGIHGVGNRSGRSQEPRTPSIPRRGSPARAEDLAEEAEHVAP